MHCEHLKVQYRNHRKYPVNSSAIGQKQFDAVILLFLVKHPFCIKQGVVWTVKSLNITIQICFFLHPADSCSNSIIRLPSHLKSVLKMTREQGIVNRDRNSFQSMLENLS